MKLANVQQERLFHTFLFFSRLLALSLPLYLIISFGNLAPFQVFVASLSNHLLNMLGLETVQNGAYLTVGMNNPTKQAFEFLISEDSTGWKSMIFLSALIFAVPKIGISKRMKGLLIGIPVIFLANLSRIIGIVLIERGYSLQAALIAHDYLWRFLLVGIALSLWVFWLRMDITSRNKNKI